MPPRNGLKMPPGGYRVGSGRKTDFFKHKFDRILEDSNWEFRLRRILARTKDDEVFMKALNLILDRRFGKPVQSIQPVDGDGEHSPLVVMLVPQSEGVKGGIV